MPVLDGNNPLFVGMYHASILSKVWLAAAHNERVPKRGESRDVSIPEVVKIVFSEAKLAAFPIAGPLLLGLCRIYMRQMDFFVSKVHNTVLHLETGMVQEKQIVPSTVKRRKRSIYDTPLHTIPENASLAYLDDVLFENQPIVVAEFSAPFPSLLSRTPNRKRVSSTPRSSESVFGISTPTLDESAKRQRRISSLSEVMDTLRADDGERRLSGLLGTTGNVDDNHFFDYADVDEFDTGIAPPESPPMMIEPMIESVVAPRKKDILRAFMDRKLENTAASVQEERSKILRYFDTPRPQVLAGVLFARSEFQGDKTAHIRWYIKQNFAKKKIDKKSIFDDSSSFPDNCEEDFSENVASVASTFKQRLVSGATLTSVIGKESSRTEAARNFMKILHLASQGEIAAFRIERKLGFSPPSVSYTVV